MPPRSDYDHLRIDMPRKLHMFKNEVTEWFIAYDVKDAQRIAREYYAEIGLSEEEMEDSLDFEQEPDDKILTLTLEDAGPDEEDRVTMTAAEWCAHQGRGFWATTEF